jgi:hypothetical protein
VSFYQALSRRIFPGMSDVRWWNYSPPEELKGHAPGWYQEAISVAADLDWARRARI